MKFCTKCEKSKPLGEFHRNKSKRDGLAGQCKSCSKKQMSSWYKKNKSRVSVKNKQYRSLHRDKANKYSSEYYRNNKAQILAKQWDYVQKR